MKIQNKKIVLYASNIVPKSNNSINVRHPSYFEIWKKVMQDHPNYTFHLVISESCNFFDQPISCGERKTIHSVNTIVLKYNDTPEKYVSEILKLKPDIVIPMSGPVLGMDLNSLMDSTIADEILKLNKNIKILFTPSKTSLVCANKYETYRFLKDNGFNTIKSFLINTINFNAKLNFNAYREYILAKLKFITYPAILKPVNFSGSIGVKLFKNQNDLTKYLLTKKFDDDIIIQEFIDGEEFGTEVHIVNGKHFVFPPYRIQSLSNETINSQSFKTIKYGPILGKKYNVKHLIKQLQKLAKLLDFSGIVEIDLFFSKGKWYICEINNRRSGITPLAGSSTSKNLFDIYLDQIECGKKLSRSNLLHSCLFKIDKMPSDLYEKLRKDPHTYQILRYKSVINGAQIDFTEVVLSKFKSTEEMVDYLKNYSQKYVNYIPEIIPNTIFLSTRETRYAVGVTSGSYNPLHYGHIACFNQALKKCDELHVFVRYVEGVDIVKWETKKKWFDELAKQYNGKLIVHKLVSKTQNKKTAPLKTIKEVFNRIDKEIGKKANLLVAGNDHKNFKFLLPFILPGKRMYIIKRVHDNELNISSSTIRTNIEKYKKWLPPYVYKTIKK